MNTADQSILRFPFILQFPAAPLVLVFSLLPSMSSFFSCLPDSEFSGFHFKCRSHFSNGFLEAHAVVAFAVPYTAIYLFWN